jgi:hypothetical protein
MKRVFLFCLLVFSVIYPQTKVTCSSAGDFYNNRAAINVDGKWGFINNRGDIIIQPVYDNPFETPAFSEGLCALRDPATDKWGYIDTSGNVVIPFKLYNLQKPFTCDVNLTYFAADPAGKKQARQSLITKPGIILLEATPTDADYNTCFKEGMARIRQKGKYGYMNMLGMVIIPCKFDEVHDFSNGLAAVKSGGKWGFINKIGVEKIPFKFSMEPKDFSCGRAFVQGANSKWAVIDSLNNLICQPVYEETGRFSDGFALVKSADDNSGDSYYSIIDTTGKTIKSFKGKEAIGFKSGFYEGMAVALDFDKGLGFINTGGKVAVDFQFSELRPFRCGLAYAEKQDASAGTTIKGFIDKTGKFVIIFEESQF